MKIIFISSSGRSGSKSLAHALDEIKGVRAYHSPFKLENYNCINYLKHLKEKEAMRRKLIKSVINKGYHYIESSVCIRCHIKDLVKEYPDCLIVHLVRDGRDFVRSGFNRPWFTRRKDRFDAICRLWVEGQHVMTQSMKKIPKKNQGGFVRLEDLVKGDIRWFIESLGLISKESVMMPLKHIAPTHNLPPWHKWNKKLVASARTIMGDELRYFGYTWS